ncbi:ABC transporter ATP-binding protein [Micromonospora sp. NPDC050980]|uniref:ABC transporter ATP-binding protein n=1 Tax=Micromonospora sp. NPDC050980 TaxID=3155161 RepID=UPI00340EECC1
MERAFFNALTEPVGSGLNPWAIVAVMVSLELARLTASLGSDVAEVVFRFSVMGRLRRGLLHRLLSRPRVTAQNSSLSGTHSRFRDDVEDVGTFTTAPVTLFGTFLFSVIAVILMLRINALLTSIVVLPLMLVVTVATLANARVGRYRAESREATAQVAEFLGETFRSAQSIKLMGAERHVLRRFRTMNDQRRRASVRDAFFTQGLDSLFYNSVDVAVGLVLLLAAGPMTRGEFTVGDLALFDYYLYFVSRLPMSIGSTQVKYRQAKVSAERLAAVDEADLAWLATEPQQRVPSDRASMHAGRAGGSLEALKVSGLSYRHPSSARGAAGVDLYIQRGEFVVVTGPVGSGKTTVLRALVGLLPRDGGTIRWNGQLVDDPASFLVPPRVAYVPQVPNLVSDTLRENILMGVDADDAELAEAIRVAALDRDVAGLPSGTDTLVGPLGAKLSGGQAQRVAMARALVRRPDLLVVDDFASALDGETEQALLTRLAVGEAPTVLATSHRPATLAAADRVVVMADGVVVAQGPLAKLLSESEEMKGLWYQFAAEDEGEGPGNDKSVQSAPAT